MAGESPASYLRRLARANHLRPGYLRRYLRQPGGEGTIRLDWLAILSGRPLPTLERALSGPASSHTATGRPQPGRRHVRQAEKPRLFAAIRRDARDNGLSIRALADRHGVHRRTVRQALASPWPAPRKRPQRCSRLDPFKDTIDAILLSELGASGKPRQTVKQISDHLAAAHKMTGVSYATVRDYVAGRRLALQYGSACLRDVQQWPARGIDQSDEEQRSVDSEGLRPVPAALPEIVRRWTDRKMPPQPGSRWSRVSWAREFESHQDFLNSLPDRVDRAEAARHAQKARTAEEAVRAFLVAMIWGYGPVGYGPYRTARVLRENPGAGGRLADITRIAQDEGALAAFADIERQPLRYLGVAFGTKYLYFCTTASHRTSPILDAVVCRWLATNANLRLNIDTWHTAEYKRYLDALEDWSAQLGPRPAQLEELIFRDGASREGSALWGENWASTDEPPEPAEISLDARQAIDQLKGLFTATEPGLADQAQPHLDALDRLIKQIWPAPDEQ